VSTATVSLALRDSPLVADATQATASRMRAIELGYIYNRRAASACRTSRSGIIGVVVHDIMNPFYGRDPQGDRDGTRPQSRQTFILSNHYDSGRQAARLPRDALCNWAGTA
jgi:DNA-binding LacI/PurR family transcriptional regulator